MSPRSARPATRQTSMPNLQFDEDTMAKFQQAMAAGVPEEINIRKASEYQMRKSSAAPSAQRGGGGLGNALIDLLPLIGGIGGSFIPGAGTIVGGALGAGAGTLLRQGIKDEPINAGEAAKEAVFAGVGGLAGKGLGFLGSKLLPKISPGLTGAGKSLAGKAFRINPSQATRYAEETGEQFGAAMARRSIGNADDLAKAISALQDPFDEVVNSANLLVPTDDIWLRFNRKLAQLNKSVIPSDQAKAKVVQKIRDNFLQQYGEAPIPAKVLTQLRKEMDDVIGNFPLDEGTKGPLNVARDILQGTLRDTAELQGIKVAGQSVKDAGVELSKLYKAQEIATRQGNLGVGSPPAGILRLLGGGLGGAVGGVEGAGLGAAATGMINDPGNLGQLSKFFTGAGKATAGIPGLPESAVPALTRGGIGVGAAMGMPGEAQAAPLPDTIPSLGDTGISSATGQGQMGAGADFGFGAGSGGQTEDLRQVIGALMLQNAKSTGDLKSAYDFLFPTEKPLTGEQQKIKASADSGLRSLDKLESILQTDKNAPIKSQIPIVKGKSPYAAAAKEVADAFMRVRTGAQINDQEMKLYLSQLPQWYDSPETIEYKISIFRKLFNQLAHRQVPAAQEATLDENSSVYSY